MLELLTGSGLAASAGLNAYIPLLAVGLLGRFTELISLPSGWQWLENPWVLGVLGVLLVVEMVADKVPVVDHVNDVLQTVVRPTSGGLVFGASSMSETATVTDPAAFYESNQWVPIVTGIAISLGVHAMKATVRAVVNAMTAGIGGPVVSVFEDAVSITMSLAAILLPIVVLFFLVGLVVLFWWARRRRRQRRLARV